MLEVGRTRASGLEARLADIERVNADQRRRLDQADADRRQALDRLAAAQERSAALLTDQRQATRRLRCGDWWRR